MLKKGKTDAAKKLTIASRKNIDEISDLMHIYRPSKKDQFGLGQMLQNFARAVPPNALKDPGGNEESAYRIAAMAELTLAMAPSQDRAGDKTNKFWIENAKELREASIELAKASAANDAKAMTKAAFKANSACINCHSKFK